MVLNFLLMMTEHSKQSELHKAYIYKRISWMDEKDQVEEGFLREGNPTQRIRGDNENTKVKGRMGPSLVLKSLN